MKKTFTLLIAAIAAIMMMTQPGKAIGQTTYTFTSKSWADSQSAWDSDKDATGMDGTGRGVQVHANESGAGATSKSSFSNITNISINAAKASSASGTIKVYVGNTEVLSKSSSNLTTSSSDYSVNLSASPKTGNVSFVITSTNKSLYLKSITITYSTDPTITIGTPTGGTFTVKKTSDGSNISTGLIASGTGITLNATPSTGYAFTSWNVYKTGDQTTTVTVTNNQFSMPSYNTTVNATFTKQSYNVTLGSPADADLSATDMGEISISEGETKAVPYGTELVLEADMESGKMFSWKVTKTGVTPEVDVTSTVLSGITATDAVLTVPDYAVTVSGIVQDLKYIVTYKANGGVGSDVVEYYSPGANVTVADNAFTYSGHVFKNWNTKDDGEGTDYAEGATISGIAADVTLYAQWADAWTVTLNSNGSTTTTEVEKTQSITLSSPASVPSGFVYKGWTGTPETPFNMVSTTYTPTANVTLYAVFAKTVQEYTEKTTLLHGSILKTGDDITSSITKTSDGISYTLVPSSSNKIKRMAVPNTASDEFPGVDSTILIGKEGAYIKNNTPFGEGITKFEIYQNGGASTKVTVGVYFKTTTIDAYVAYNSSTNINSWEGGLSTLDEVYDASSALYNASSELIGAKYFWYQVTNANNSQIAFRIKYIAPVYYTRVFQDETLTAATTINGPSIIPSGKTLNAGSYLTNTNAANLVIEDGGKLVTHNAVQATVKKNVTAAANWGTTGDSYTPDGWYFIASPVDDAAFPTGTVATQDIYQLDWANNKWLNLQNSDNSSLFDAGFQSGTGYLYASKDGNTISVAGEIQPLSNDNDATVTLANDGWNLIGNPLTCKVTVDKAFSELTNASSVTNSASGSAINPFQGIAVYGNAGTTVTFTKATTQNAAAPSNNSSLQMTLAKKVTSRGETSSKVVDNAVVSFSESKGLPKFNMLGGNVKLYIPQNDEEYAVAFSNKHGDVPLNFKTDEVGTYTISFEGEEMDLNGIYLIDILDEQEIDLSAEPSYTFIGSPADRAARFKIVFRNVNGSNNSDIFAYQNGSDIVVTGEGELQIFDVMGRIVSKQYVSGVETMCTSSVPTGVYIFKLNGMTQKIVVR